MSTLFNYANPDNVLSSDLKHLNTYDFGDFEANNEIVNVKAFVISDMFSSKVYLGNDLKYLALEYVCCVQHYPFIKEKDELDSFSNQFIKEALDKLAKADTSYAYYNHFKTAIDILLNDYCEAIK